MKIREVKTKGEEEIYTHLNAEFQRIARRDKKAFLSDQSKEIEENNRMEKTRGVAACSGFASRQEACAGERAGPGFQVPPPQTSPQSFRPVLLLTRQPIKSCVENCVVPLLSLAWSPPGCGWGSVNSPPVRRVLDALPSHRLMCPQSGASVGAVARRPEAFDACGELPPAVCS